MSALRSIFGCVRNVSVFSRSLALPSGSIKSNLGLLCTGPKHFNQVAASTSFTQKRCMQTKSDTEMSNFLRDEIQAKTEKVLTWPDYIIHEFNLIPLPVRYESKFYYAYGTLLRHLFPLKEGFRIEIKSQFIPPVDLPGRPAIHQINAAAILSVHKKEHPVFILQIKKPGNLIPDNFRAEADQQIRDRFYDMKTFLNLPVLHGICAFGTKLGFYSYDVNLGSVNPPLSRHGPVIAMFNTDLISEDGFKKVHEVVHSVKMMVDAHLQK